ncbi:glycosyl transferase family 1 [Methylomonas methanica]|uniref:Glycosyl transferase family 1 n=1 Tax=Methylomonas methanica TaxID=421 RepID=A0ABY2CL40_METMH|nr:glycosyl transferase family 1 [Methylomonas methanica]
MLDALLQTLDNKNKYVLSLDERMPVSLACANTAEIRRVSPSIISRLAAELWLSRTVSADDTVLCFGNLPPLFKLRGRVFVFVQNRYLIDDISTDKFPLNVRFRLFIERFWLLKKNGNVNEFIVQTPTMKHLLEGKIRSLMKIRVLPFVADPVGYTRSIKLSEEGSSAKDFSFFYVASGEPHKNHKLLLKAWRNLADQGLFPILFLTLDQSRFSELCKEIDFMRQQYSLNITNLDNLSHQDVLAFYKKVDALIYPSTFESFGLPLIEARQAGLPILAPELDYVRDLVDPEQTFDPASPISISRAVKQFIGVNQDPLSLMDATAFMASVLKRVE